MQLSRCFPFTGKPGPGRAPENRITKLANLFLTPAIPELEVTGNVRGRWACTHRTRVPVDLGNTHRPEGRTSDSVGPGERPELRLPKTPLVSKGAGILPRKEVIQPHLPVRLPCYDFTPIIYPALDGCFLAVGSPASGVTNFRGVTGGVYKARERIHRSMLTCGY